MSDFDEAPFDDFDNSSFDDFEDETLISDSSEAGSKARSGNRNFMITIGILAAVFIVVVIVLIVIAAVVLPGNRDARLEEAALVNAHNTATSVAATNFAIAQEQAAIPTATPVQEDTLEPTATPVVVFDTETPAVSIVDLTATAEKEIGGPPSGDGADRTATVAALLTQAAQGGTAVVTVQAGATITALPDTGLADQVGLPVLFGLASLFVVIVFLVRRFRLSS